MLPISGDPLTDVSLDLVFPKGTPYFSLNGKRLQLLSPLDRDKDNLSHIVFQVHSPSFIHEILLTHSLVQHHFMIINILDLQPNESNSYRVVVYLILVVSSKIFTLTMWKRFISTRSLIFCSYF